jgi:adenine-specific DNA-methyltransferase
LVILYNFLNQAPNIKPKLIFLDLPFYSEALSAYSEPPSFDIDETFFHNIFLLSKEVNHLIAPDGFYVIKVPNHNSHYIKVMLDEIFGISHFVNEILIRAPNLIKNCAEIDLYQRTIPLLVYSPSNRPVINPVYYGRKGGGYWHSMVSKGQGGPLYFTIEGEKTLLEPAPGTHWKFKQETIFEMERKGLIQFNTRGTPEYWVPPNLGQIINTTWWDKLSHENTPLGFETSDQILKRLLDTFTKENDLFLHIFSGSGIGLLTAEMTQRRWIGVECRQIGIENMLKKAKNINFELLSIQKTGHGTLNHPGEAK